MTTLQRLTAAMSKAVAPAWRVALMAPVATRPLGRRLGDYLTRPLTILLLIILLGCSLLLVALRQRILRRRSRRGAGGPEGEIIQ